MINVTIQLFNFNELSERAQKRAIDDHRNFLLSVMQPNDFVSGCTEYDTPEQLQEQYEQEYEYYLFNDDPIVESIECNDYMFFANGELANTVHYIATGKTVFEFAGIKMEV